VPDLESLVQGREVGEKCSGDLVQKRTSDPNFVGNFNLTFTLPGTLVRLSFTVLCCVTHFGEYRLVNGVWLSERSYSYYCWRVLV
jgi:hypothetical protein